LTYLQGRSPGQANIINLAAYAYTLCFVTLILPALFHWAVGSLPSIKTGGDGPERVQLAMIAVIAAGIRYFFHPYAKTVTLRGKPRQSLWLDVKQEMPLALAIVIPLVALYLGTADWTVSHYTNRTSPIPPAHAPAVSPQR
jgi:hypothetical protein